MVFPKTIGIVIWLSEVGSSFFNPLGAGHFAFSCK